jgi:hypothetical protein
MVLDTVGSTGCCCPYAERMSTVITILGDIDFVSHDCVKLFLKTSKTDVYRQGVYIKLLKTDNDLCSY